MTVRGVLGSEEPSDYSASVRNSRPAVARRDTKKRVVGLLLGETYKGVVQVTNSFAREFVPDLGQHKARCYDS